MASQICFQAQQAAEKAFKAVLLARRIRFPLTHDIDELIEIFDEHKIEISSNVRTAGRLTPFAVEMRYPGSAGGLLEKEISEAVKLAEDVIKWAKNILQADRSRLTTSRDDEKKGNPNG